MTIPSEVENYFKNGRRKITSVRANENFSLLITFDNDEQRVFDMTESLKGDIFRPLNDFTAFSRVYIDEQGCIAWDIDPNVDSKIVWNNKIDLCPDSCYIYSKRTV
jgi:hypothetical protein